jgi:hypothetical protein
MGKNGGGLFIFLLLAAIIVAVAWGIVRGIGTMAHARADMYREQKSVEIESDEFDLSVRKEKWDAIQDEWQTSMENFVNSVAWTVKWGFKVVATATIITLSLTVVVLGIGFSYNFFQRKTMEAHQVLPDRAILFPGHNIYDARLGTSNDYTQPVSMPPEDRARSLADYRSTVMNGYSEIVTAALTRIQTRGFATVGEQHLLEKLGIKEKEVLDGQWKEISESEARKKLINMGD